MAAIARQTDPNGLSGLSNFGATCYMNSALQSLLATPSFVAYLMHSNILLTDIEKNIISSDFKKHERANTTDDTFTIDPDEITKRAKKTLPYKLREIAIQYWKINCEIKPVQFRQTVIRELPYFSENIQHDTQDFLQQLIDNIHESTCGLGKIALDYTENETKLLEMDKLKTNNKSIEFLAEYYAIIGNDKKTYYEMRAKQKWIETLQKSYSVINDIFSGMFMDTIECNNCKNIQYKFDTFNFITLSVPENVDDKKTEYTLDELFVHYINNETLSGTNQYNCEFCKSKQDATKHSYIYQLPSVLIILIKKWQKHNGNIFKSNIKVSYEHTFNPQPYTTQYTQTDKKYELYSVIRHSGGANGGHYYTYNKNALNKSWYMHDDGNVFEVDNNDPLNCNGYVLCYTHI